MIERRKFGWIAAAFLAAYFVPMQHERVRGAILEAFAMLQDYARKHVLTCLVPAFFIAGAIAVFVSRESVLRYFGPRANKVLSYSVASVSGTILAVCSCTVLPLFAGLYTRGAGIGPATAFLYSGPAINVLAIILTARVLGASLGIARAVGAVLLSVVLGLMMALLFPDGDGNEEDDDLVGSAGHGDRPLYRTALYILTMVLILVFAAWGKPSSPVGFWNAVYEVHWYLTIALLAVLAWMLAKWFRKEELQEWTQVTKGFALQIFPLLLGGVLVAGFLMGMPGTDKGVIPSRYVQALVGGNSLWANFFAAITGAFMYFATLTEVPILQGLLGSGMGKGPALSLLLAGPALSLPSMIVIGSIMGWKRALVYISLVVVFSTLAGMAFGALGM